MRKIVIVAFVMLMLTACMDSKKKYAKAILQEWIGKKVIFPSNLFFTIPNGDTVSYHIGKKCKILTYVDSIGCTSCKLQFSKWGKFISVVDSICPDSVQFLFFFYPKKEREIYQILRGEKFYNPVCIDKKDSLNILNQFPNEIAFQTFLLDRDNKVVAIGNPIHNSKVKELYLRIIQSGEVKPDNEKNIIQTEANVDRNTVSLGRFDWQEEQKASFTLKNIGKSLLVIEDVNTSCGCTEVTYSKEPVQPGDSILLNVSYKAEHPEHFDKTITVYCNAKSSPVVLKITGDAK